MRYRAETGKEHPDVALVGLGESSQHPLELIEQIVCNAACPVILILDARARDQDFVNEAAKRSVFAYIVDGDKDQLESAPHIFHPRKRAVDGVRAAWLRSVLSRSSQSARLRSTRLQ